MLFVILSLMVLANLMRCVGRHKDKVATETEIVTDTVRYPVPMAKDSTVIRYVTYKVPKTRIVSDTVRNIVFDTVEVEVPVMQKVYADSSYRAWVSGYSACLDSIEIYQKLRTVTVTKVEKKYRKFGLGVSAGYGYGIDSRSFSPYVGIGLQYNLISF